MAVIPSLRHGGAERVLSLLSLEWTRAHDVIIVAFDASCPAYRYGGAIIDLKLSRPRNIVMKFRVACLSTFRLILLFVRNRPDRVIGFMEPANLPSIVAAAVTLMRKKLVVSVHHNPQALSWVRRGLIGSLYRFPALVVGVSFGVSAALRALPASLWRVVTIHNPVADVEGPIAADSGIPDPYILGVGRLHRDKGFDRLLRAFALIADDDLKLAIVGDGEERESLLALATALGIADRLLLPGAVSDVGVWYRHAACYVLASRTEAFSMTIVEAMLHGCPVISFDCDFGPREIIQHSENGLLIEDGDIPALAVAVTRIVGDKKVRSSMLTQGYARAAAFTVEAISDRWLRVLEAIDD